MPELPELEGSPPPAAGDPSLATAAGANTTTSFAAVDAAPAPSSPASASLAEAEAACPAVDLTVTVDPIAAVIGDYSFGAVLLDNGQLPFELPRYEGVAEVYAVPMEIPLNCTTGLINFPSALASLLRLGSVPLEAVAGSTSYAANFTLTPEIGMRLKWKLPSLAGGYHVIVNVTSTSSADLYDDTVDTCFTYTCDLF